MKLPARLIDDIDGGLWDKCVGVMGGGGNYCGLIMKTNHVIEQTKHRQGLSSLEDDPFTPRSGADIKPIQQTVPKKYRSRIGELRIIYTIKEDCILIIEVFRRVQGYSL